MDKMMREDLLNMRVRGERSFLIFSGIKKRPEGRLLFSLYIKG